MFPRSSLRAGFAASAVVLLGCGAAADQPDATAITDAPILADAAPDAGEADAWVGVPLPGFGTITGDCGLVDADAIDRADPAMLRNAIDFATAPYTDDDLAELSAGAREIYLDGNAGGSSIYSEMFAYDVLYRCELADLLKTETEIIYDTQGKITDLLTSLAGRKVGVSVTRAFAFPPDEPYTVAQARALLDDKLGDVLDSTANVAAEDAWVKQILHILAYEPMHADSLATAYPDVDPAVRADTIVVITVTHGADAFMY